MSVILNVASVQFSIPAIAGLGLGLASLFAWLVNTQFSIVNTQCQVKDSSELINGMSSVLQKLLKYSNGTKISTFSFPTILFSNFPAVLDL